jgi:predicted N-formylglutamate amidohydrolase
MTDTAYRLLTEDDPPPVLEYRRDGGSDFVIVVDHASCRIPKLLGSLGLSPIELTRHIAWDIGALEVGRRVSEALDAALVAQSYSRLVIDCNRNPADPSSIPTISELTDIPGNVRLTSEELLARRAEIFHPYHEHLRALLDERQRAGRKTILVAQHSMTNVFKGVQRRMHAAILSNRDRRLANALLCVLRSERGLIVGDNEPYSGRAGTSYTLPNHAETRTLPHVEIEIRQDLIQHELGQTEWARRLATALAEVEKSLGDA